MLAQRVDELGELHRAITGAVDMHLQRRLHEIVEDIAAPTNLARSGGACEEHLRGAGHKVGSEHEGLAGKQKSFHLEQQPVRDRLVEIDVDPRPAGQADVDEGRALSIAVEHVGALADGASGDQRQLVFEAPAREIATYVAALADRNLRAERAGAGTFDADHRQQCAALSLAPPARQRQNGRIVYGIAMHRAGGLIKRVEHLRLHLYRPITRSTSGAKPVAAWQRGVPRR